MSYTCSLETLPFCCGFKEAGEFGGDEDHWGNILEEDTPEKLLDIILEESGGRPVIFNFVKCRDYNQQYYKEYQYQELRKIVMAHKNVVDLGKSINPSTKNRIHSLIIKDYK